MFNITIFLSSIMMLAFYFGMIALFVIVCRKIAQSKNLSTNYMWFGLLGVIGIIIVAVMPANQNYNPYYDPRNNSYNPYMNQYQYGQNQYNQNTYGQNGGNQGYTLNGQYYQNGADGKRCNKCGASVSSDSDYCPFCGNKVS